jgi:hypothetical protein
MSQAEGRMNQEADLSRTGPAVGADAPAAPVTGGLTAAEAARRLGQYGPNELVEKERNPLLAFLAYSGCTRWRAAPLHRHYS